MTTTISPNKSNGTPDANIYETTFKKGNLLQRLHFMSDGGLPKAIVKAKNFCNVNRLMHIHTVPFLLDIEKNNEMSDDEGIDPFAP